MYAPHSRARHSRNLQDWVRDHLVVTIEKHTSLKLKLLDCVRVSVLFKATYLTLCSLLRAHYYVLTIMSSLLCACYYVPTIMCSLLCAHLVPRAEAEL